MIGNWIRINDKRSETTYEKWNALSENSLTGMGCTISNLDTVFREDIKIMKKNEKWVFRVSQGSDSSTEFDIHQISFQEFSCSNLENEFPKNIHYKKTEQGLYAEIFNEETEKITFNFIEDK